MSTWAISHASIVPKAQGRPDRSIGETCCTLESAPFGSRLSGGLPQLWRLLTACKPSAVPAPAHSLHTGRVATDVFVGFDSAWTDNLKAPGAICAVGFKAGVATSFWHPRLASFEQALSFINEVRSGDGVTLIAIDQPTIVPNMSSMRPVERVAASLISWMGGGVQPSNRGRKGMFCDASSIWKFLTDLGAVEHPEDARTSTTGCFIMEVFPAIALASLSPDFFGRLSAPRYNPARKLTFQIEDWARVGTVAADAARQLNCSDLANWCADKAAMKQPRKADQDTLDAALCAVIALRWRLRPREESLILGDRVSGYMVLPASPAVRAKLAVKAVEHSVPIDGVKPAAV